MSESLKPLPLYELVRHIRGMVESWQWDGDCTLCADELEAQLRAWAEEAKIWHVIDGEFVRECLLGVPPK